MLEFALVLPVLLLLAFGGFELGRALLVSLAADGAVRGGARYLARLPNPTCRPECPDGVRHAISLATDAIVANTGLSPAAVRVGPDPSPPPGAVVMEAEIQLRVETLGALGRAATWTVRASHREDRVAE